MVASPRVLLLLLVSAASLAEAGIEGSVSVIFANYFMPPELPEGAEDQEGIRKRLGWSKEKFQHNARNWNPSMSIESGTDEVEAPVEVRVRNDPSEITLLSRHTFDNNVVNDKNGDLLVEHWVVEFCVHWWEPCQRFSTHFNDIGQRVTEELNGDRAVTKRVNFARVNCATDKVLCNEQAVQEYPTVRHYYRGQGVTTWRRKQPKLDHERLLAWVTFELKERLWGEEKDREDRKDDKPLELPYEWREVAATLVAILGCCWALRGVATAGTVVPRTAPRPAARPSASAEPESAAPAPAATTRLLPREWVEERKEVEL